jgi:hypothetical protein
MRAHHNSILPDESENNNSFFSIIGHSSISHQSISMKISKTQYKASLRKKYIFRCFENSKPIFTAKCTSLHPKECVPINEGCVGHLKNEGMFTLVPNGKSFKVKDNHSVFASIEATGNVGIKTSSGTTMDLVRQRAYVNPSSCRVESFSLACKDNLSEDFCLVKRINDSTYEVQNLMIEEKIIGFAVVLSCFFASS